MKKALLICVIIATLLILTCSTLSCFTDTETGRGFVSSGELCIRQHEYGVYAGPGSENNTPFEHNQILYPGSAVDKIVTVENIGSLPAYVRTFVAVPTAGNGKTLASLTHGTDKNWVWADPITNVNIDGAVYDIFCAVYTIPLAAGETTPPCILGYTVSPNVTQNKSQYVYQDGTTLIPLGKSEVFNIRVATEASQTLMFEDVYDAMNVSFGTSTEHHPW